MLWGNDINQRPDVEEGGDELKLIPLWSVLLSLAVFCGCAGAQLLGASGPAAASGQSRHARHRQL